MKLEINHVTRPPEDGLLVMRSVEPGMLVAESENCMELDCEESRWCCFLLTLTIHSNIPKGATSTAT